MASSQFFLHRKENTSIIKILLAQEQKCYTYDMYQQGKNQRANQGISKYLQMLEQIFVHDDFPSPYAMVEGTVY